MAKKTARKKATSSAKGRKSLKKSMNDVKKAQGNLNLKLKKHQQVMSAMHYSVNSGSGGGQP